MNTLRYKGYLGSVAYSDADKVFYGKIEGIDGLVNYEGESVTELTDAFKEAVDDYILFCEEHDIKPQKSYSGSFNVRIAPMVHRAIANRAAEAGISINAFVKRALENAILTPASYSTEHGMLMEPDEPVHYGNRDTVVFRVPAEDLPFAMDLARRMGWESD